MNKNNIAGKIVSDYIDLVSIRNQWWFESNLADWIKQSQLHKEEWDRYKTNIARAASDQQKAELLHNNPIFDFIPLDRDARANVYALKEAWKYWWKVDETDWKIYDVVSDAADFGSWFLYQWWKIENRTVSIPKYNKISKKIEFEEKLIEQYSWVYSEYIRIEDIYFDWTTIENSNVCIWRKFWDRRDFINTHKTNHLFSLPEELPWYDIFLADNPKLPKLKLGNTENMLVELKYYNKAEDKLIILANWVVVSNNPIPHLHKELPFVKYDNHIYRDRLIQMWNYELLSSVEEYLDKVRLQTIDVTKANIWFWIMEKDWDFDPEIHKIWVYDFIEMENPDWFKHYSANIQTGWLNQLQSSWQEDAIILSWVDYRSQLMTSWETATKTASKNASALKRINLILKRNSFKFYNRLAKLRLADLQWIHSLWEHKIPLKGLHVEWDNFIKLQDWYWLFTIKPKMFKWEFNVVMQTESLLWDSTEKEKENYLNFFQIFGNLADENNKPIINKKRMVEIAGQKIWVDVDLLLEAEVANKSWEEMINSLLQEMNWQSNIGNNSNNPDYIPPENRANNAWWVQVIWWGNTANQF